MIVVDASALVEVLLRRPAATRIERRLINIQQALNAPHLVDIEIANVVRRFEALGALDAERGRQAIADLGDLSLHRHSHHHFLPRIWDLRHNLTAYDAVYVALAEILDAPLITCDRRLAAAPGNRARIELF